MRWLREHKITATILIIAVLLIAILVASYQLQGKDNAVGRVASGIVNTVQKPISGAGDYLSDAISGLFTNDEFEQENQELKEKIRELESELISANLSSAELEELSQVNDRLNYTKLNESFDVVTADVIAMDGSSYFNIFTIGAGSDNGIKVDSVVMNGDGIVGRVVSTTKNSAKVISVIDESYKIGFQVFRDLALLGICEGDGNGGLSGYLLDEKAVVKEGDRLITSGIGGIYPAGLIIGQVTKVEWTHDSPLKTVEIKPAVNFKSIKRVTVLI